MATTAATLDILVNARTQSATSSLRRMDQSTRTSATHLKNLDKTSGHLTSTLSRVGRAAVGAAAGYVGLSAAKTAITNTADLAKTTMSLNKNMGFTVKTASELGANLKIRGSDAKQAQMAFATFSGVLHQAAQGSASARDRLAELGISGKKLQRDLKNPEQALFDVSDGLKNLGAGMQRTDDTRKLFGRGWSALSPILRGGSVELKKNLDLADQMGASFSNLGIHDMQDFIDAQHKAQLGMLGLQIGFTQTLAPALTDAMSAFGDLAKNIRQKGFVPAISDAISKAATKAGEMAPKVLEAFAKGFANTNLAGKLALSAILIGKFGGAKAFLGLGKIFGAAIIEGLAATKLGASLLSMFPTVGKMNEEGRVKGAAMGSGLTAGLILGTVGLAAVVGQQLAKNAPKPTLFSTGYIQRQFAYAKDAVTSFTGKLPDMGIAASKSIQKTGGLFGQLAGTIKGKIGAAIGSAVGYVTGMPGRVKGALSGLADKIAAPFSAAVGLIRGFINDIVGVINSVLGVVGVHIGGGTGPSGTTGNVGGGRGGKGGGEKGLAKSHGKQRGGMILVGGSGTGDIVPAMLEPGEGVLNKKLVSAIGGERGVNQLNKAVPRFQVGGVASGAANVIGGAISGGGPSMPKLPGVGNLPNWIQPAGSFVLDKVGGFIKSKLASLVGIGGGTGPGGVGSYKGIPMANWVIQSLQFAASKGIAPQPTSGYRPPTQIVRGPVVAAQGHSEHAGTGYPHGAVDFGGPLDPAALIKKMAVVNATRRFKWPLLAPIGFRDDGHASGTGHQRGGIIQKLAKGGIIGDFARAVIDTKAPKNAGVALFEAGFAESGMRDLAGGDASSTGVLQLLASTASNMGLNPHDPYAVAKAFLTRGYYKYGSAISMANMSPAQIATRTQGNATGAGVYSAQHGAAISAIRAAGLKWGKNGRPMIAGTGRAPKVGKTPKTKGGKGGGSGSNAFDDALQNWRDTVGARRGSANELIGEGNLEALQRYQVGASQNPLLGLGKPGLPSLQGLLSTDPTLDDIIGIDKQLYAPGGGPFTQLPAKHQDWGGTAGFQNRPVHHHTHVHVDGKEVAHVVHKENKKEARRGRRPLPSSRRQ